jgi:hypothetical protein
LVKDFHFLSTSHHNLVAVGLLETFLNLEKIGNENKFKFQRKSLINLLTGGKVFSDIVEAITWQGILWTCSHQVYVLILNSHHNNLIQ